MEWLREVWADVRKPLRMVLAHAVTAIAAILGLAAAEFVSRLAGVDEAIIP